MSLQPYLDLLAELGDAPAVRTVYAAAHLAVHDEAGTQIDWATTESLRRFMDQNGFGIAEAMDTAQRFELGWDIAKELIERTAALQLNHGFAAGAAADHAPTQSFAGLASAVAEQVEFIRDLGGLPVILPMPELARQGAPPDHYVDVYASILEQSQGKILLHWLGPMFLPGLDDYFPGDSFQRIMDLDHERIVGVKLSLLDGDLERKIRTDLAINGQFVYTGDDFNFAELIAGESDLHQQSSHDPKNIGRFSHALLGIFDGIARPAGIALRLLAHGKRTEFLQIMQPCEELSRVIFESPTQHYKAGLAYLSWLDGRQENPWLPKQAQLQRNARHYQQVRSLAVKANVFANPHVATQKSL
ncbi:MAG: DUF993 family protein [Planctomycetes bacterium]|nr:DUF993 family protein [Planctomycetota bacterium]